MHANAMYAYKLDNILHAWLYRTQIITNDLSAPFWRAVFEYAQLTVLTKTAEMRT